MALVAALSLEVPAVAAQTGPGELAQNQIAKLRSQPLPIVVPRYVPAGFHLAEVDARKAKANGSANHYTLVYRSAGGGHFTIDVADGEFGDADPDFSSFRRPFVANSNLVGSTKMSPYQFTDAAGHPQPWFYSSDYRSLERLGNAKAVLIFSGTISPDELRRIYSSLQQVPR